MNTTTLKQIIKEAVKEAVREVLHEETNPKQRVNENLSFTSEDAQAFGMMRNQLKGKMDAEFGFTPSSAKKIVPKVIDTPQGPKQLSIFEQAMLETANEVSAQEMAQFRSQV